MTEVIPTNVIKDRVEFRNASGVNSYLTVNTETDTEHDITQNVANFSTDVNSTFTNINNQERRLKISTIYGNIRELNCRTCYMRTDVVADDGYIDSMFKRLEDLFTDEILDRIAEKVGTNFVTKSELTTSITTNSLTVNGDASITGDLSSGSLSNTSDRNLKDNIKQLIVEKSVELLNKLNVYSFNFKSDEQQKTHYGTIAQEVEEIAPELVNKVDNHLSVNYIELIPHLINYVKYLEKRVEQLEADKK